jgi:hypothetical protein
MEKRGRYINVIIITTFILIGFIMFKFTTPTITGNVIITTSQNITFTNPATFTYDSTLINLTNNVVSLNVEEINTSWTTHNYTIFEITTAYFDYSNKTDNVYDIDNDNYKIKDSDVFDITFNDFLDNGDNITLYTKSSSSNSNTIYLCKASQNCDSSNDLGTIVYDGEEGEYTFTIENLNNPQKSFSINTGEDTKVDFITSSKGNITNAIKNPSDKTTKFNSKNNDGQTIDDNDELNLIFPQNIKNNDTLAMYLLDKKVSNITICQASDWCDSNYGEIYFPDIEDWYNITIANLTYPTDRIQIVNDNKIKPDYFKVYRTEEILNSEINRTYYNATIETPVYILSSESTSGIFSVVETLNNQQINYYYSLDSGTYQPTTSNISLDNASTIKFKAELITNGTDTPTLTSLALNYDYDQCEESWSCTLWSECSGLSKKTRTCTDSNSCGTTSEKPIESKTCRKNTYNPGLNKSELISLYKNESITINSTNLELRLRGKGDVTGLNLTIKRENKNISLSGKRRILDDFNIEVDSELNNNLNETEFKVSYNEEDLGSIDESTLKIHYFNETTSEWEALNSIVDPIENFITVNLTHFSTYGIFGDEPSSESSSSSSSNSGGKSSFKRPSNNPEPKTQPIQQPTTQSQKEETNIEQQEPEFEEFTESDTLSPLTGQVVSTKNIKVKRNVNWSLIALIIFNVGFIVRSQLKRKHYKKHKKDFHEQHDDNFGL